MSIAELRKASEKVLRWHGTKPVMEFKCGGCGYWQDFKEATILKAGDANICKGCAAALFDELEQGQGE